MKPTKGMIEAFISASSTAAGGTEDCVSAGITAALAAMPVRAVAAIVPSHCSGSALAFDPGVLHVNKDGSGYIAINEDDFILDDDRDGDGGGSVHWIARMDASELTALRDFLNGCPVIDLAAENVKRLQANLRESFEALCAMRNSINEHVPLPSLESDLLQGPETSVFCSVVAEAVVNLAAENERLRTALEKAMSALTPLSDAVFNDNGDMTVSVPHLSYEQCVAAYFAAKAANAALERKP